MSKYAIFQTIAGKKIAVNPDQVVVFIESDPNHFQFAEDEREIAIKHGVTTLYTLEVPSFDEGSTSNPSCWTVRGTFKEVRSTLERCGNKKTKKGALRRLSK